MEVVATTDLSTFAAEVAPWLSRDPVRNNVIATVISARLGGLVPPEDGILLLRIVGDDGQLAGMAIRTPPQAMLLPELPPAAIEALINYVHERTPDVLAFNGPVPVASEVARAVAARTGGEVKTSRAMGRFTLERVIAPAAPAGRPQVAEARDVSLLVGWTQSFHDDIGVPSEPDSSNVDRRVGKGLVWLWETADGPVAMTGMTEPAHGIVRLNLVYTPPPHRRHGYASALVAHLSQVILDGGNIPMLFTDLANQTSNKVYQAVGFVKLDEVGLFEVT